MYVETAIQSYSKGVVRNLNKHSLTAFWQIQEEHRCQFLNYPEEKRKIKIGI